MAEAFEVAAWLKSLPCAPEFRPSEAEFADPVAYISKIEAEARTFGACKIIPPFSRASKRTAMANLNRSLLLQASESSPSSAGHSSSSSLEPESRRSVGGCMPPQKVGPYRPFSYPRTRTVPPSFSVERDDGLQAKFHTRRQQLGCSTGKRSKAPVQSLAQKVVWQSGESYTLENFEVKAKQFARARLKTSKDLPPFVIESLFWKAAADRSITVEYGNDIPGSAFGEPAQLTITDFTTRNKRKWSSEEKKLELPRHHSFKERKLHDSRLENCENGFSHPSLNADTPSRCGASLSEKLCCVVAKERLRPRKRPGRADIHGCPAGSELANSFWNMKVLPRAPGSLLRYMPDEVPGVTSPMVYIGMLFSWFAWHVEDHELHSLNYMHIGAPKTWYAVPGDAAPALEEVVRVYGYGNCLDAKASFTLLGEKTTVMSPEVLLAAGVPCCRLVQNAGEFVVTFPRAYHLGFSHGFNCGEAANFASPAWLEVAKDAATRRATMNCLPMLSHQQLLYLLALSLYRRIPRALTSEPRSSRSKVIMSSLGEEMVKTVFANDAAHNNRLLGLLVDSGVMGCILLDDGTDLSPASSEHSKVTSSPLDNNVTTLGFMDETFLEESCVIESKKKHAGASKDHCSPLQLLVDSIGTCSTQMTRRSSFCWGTLPCAACGLLCFPSIVVFQPVSNIAKALAQQHDAANNIRLSSFFSKTQDGNPSDTTHLESLFPLMSNVDLQSEYMKAPLSEPICQHVALSSAEQRPLLWDMNHEGIQELDRSSDGSNTKSYDHTLSTKIGNSNALRHDLEETQQYLGMPSTSQNDLLIDSVAAKAADTESSDELNSILQEKIFFQGSFGNAIGLGSSKAQIFSNMPENHRDLKKFGCVSTNPDFQDCESSLILDNLLLADGMESTFHRATNSRSVTSVLDLLAVTYNDELEDSALHSKQNKSSLPDSEHDDICFGPQSSLTSGDEVGCSPCHPVKKEAESSLPLGGLGKLQSFASAFATPVTELDKLLPEDVLIQAGGVDSCPCLQSVIKCTSKGEMKDKLTLLSKTVKEEHSCFLEGSQSCLDMPKWVREQFSSLDKALQVTTQFYKSLKGVDASESMKPRHLPLHNHLSVNNLQSGTPEISNVSSNVSRANISFDSRDGHHLANLIEKSDGSNFGQVCSVDMGNTSDGLTANCQILNNKSLVSCVRSDGTNKTTGGANLDSSVKWMDIEPLSIIDGNSSIDMKTKRPIEEPKCQLKSETKDIFTENAGTWARPARDCVCGEVPHGHDSPSMTSRPRFLCLEHALEAHHHLKPKGGSRMLIVCHSDIIKMENNAQNYAQELSLAHTWRHIPYYEANQEQKHLIDMAIKVYEEGEDDSLDWGFQLGMSVDHQNKAFPKASLYDTDINCEARAEPLTCTNNAREDEAIGQRGMPRKVSVAGNWCGKVWMADQVHPALGGCYTAHLQLQALQNTGRDCMNNEKALSIERMCSGSFKEYAKCAEGTNPISSHANAGMLSESMVEIKRSDRKEKVSEHLISSSLEDFACPTASLSESKCREIQGDSSVLDTSCLSPVRIKLNSFEGPFFSNQGDRDNCCTFQSSYGKRLNSQSGNSQVSDVDAFKHDGPDMDIWQDLDVGCYSQEALLLDTIEGSNEPLTVGTCHELDVEAQEEFIPSMLRSFSPFDSADYFFEGPSTRLRSRSTAKPVSTDDDVVVNMKHSETLFGNGKRCKQPCQKSKKSATKDLEEEECGAYVCELDGCSMSFSSKHELNLHRRNMCGFAGCGKRFGSHKYLLQHRRVHLDDRPLKCPWKGCKMTFKWKWACTEHYRVHTGERPYVCPFPDCGCTFRFVSDFSRHKRKTGHTK